MKCIFLAFIFFIITAVAFSQNGGGVGIFVPLTASFSISDIEYNKNSVPNADKKYYGLKSDAGFEWGVLLQPGYFWGFGNLAGIDVLLDIGYYRNVLSYIGTNKRDNARYRESYAFDTLNIGLIPKFNILFLSIGIGGGIKIPFAADHYIKYLGDNGKTIGSFKERLDSDRLKSIFSSSVIPYIKITLDFLVNFNKFSAITVGIYANYDFTIHKKLNDYESAIYSKYDLSSFDFGFQIGLYLVGNKN